MDKKEELKKLLKEVDFYRKEYHEIICKQKYQKLIEYKDEFVTFFKSHDFVIEIIDPVNAAAKSIEREFKFVPLYNYNELHNHTFGFKIIVIDNFGKDKEGFFVRSFNSEPLPEGNLNNLKVNHYKGMNIDEIKIYEQKKNLAYFIDYIKNSSENFSNERDLLGILLTNAMIIRTS